MIVVLPRPTSQPAVLAGPQLSPEGIVFHNVGPDRVRIEVTVSNPGPGPTPALPAVVQAAPLGAFVPWRPVAVLSLPTLAPGETTTVFTEAELPNVSPLGPPDRVTPRQLLTALDFDEDRRRGRAAELPADPLMLLRQGAVHWAGNLNVFVGGKAVERHVARALRVYPERTNLAMFVVGSGHDAYRFHLEGTATDWDARLCDVTGANRVIDLTGGTPVAEQEWLEVAQQRMMLLALVPPSDCQAGSVEVHVEQRSTGQTAVVEFSLDPIADGPGCYVVS
jgi:hypothetical protein